MCVRENESVCVCFDVCFSWCVVHVSVIDDVLVLASVLSLCLCFSCFHNLFFSWNQKQNFLCLM